MAKLEGFWANVCVKITLDISERNQQCQLFYCLLPKLHFCVTVPNRRVDNVFYRFCDEELSIALVFKILPVFIAGIVYTFFNGP